MKRLTALFCFYIMLYLTFAPCLLYGNWVSYSAPSSNDDRLIHGTVYDHDNDKIYMIGGGPDGYSTSMTRYIYRYDPQYDTWETNLSLMPSARGWIQGAYWNGHIYVIGGWNTSGTPQNTLYIYDIAGDSWSTGASIPQARLAHGTVAWNGNVFVVGGTNLTTGFTSVYRYNISGNSWTQCTSLPVAWDMGGCAIVDSVIYLCGGYNRNDTVTWDSIYSGTINGSNPDNITWAQEVALDVPTGNCAATSMNGDVYILGGFDETKSPKMTFLRFAIVTGILYILLMYPIAMTRNHFSVGRTTRTVDEVYGVAGDANGTWFPPNNYYYKINDPAGIAMLPIERKLTASILGITPSIGNRTFTISFAIPSSTPVSLTLHNILGQRIMTMHEGNTPAGEHKILLSSAKLPAGVYFVNMHAGKEHLTEKFVVAK